jgi:hypothetical protein
VGDERTNERTNERTENRLAHHTTHSRTTFHTKCSTAPGRTAGSSSAVDDRRGPRPHIAACGLRHEQPMSNPGAIRVTGHPHTNVNRGRAPPATRLERLRELLSTSDKKKRGTRYSLPRLRRDAASTARAAVQPSTAGEKHAHAHTGLVGHHRLTLCAHALHMHIHTAVVGWSPWALGSFLTRALRCSLDPN